MLSLTFLPWASAIDDQAGTYQAVVALVRHDERIQTMGSGQPDILLGFSLN